MDIELTPEGSIIAIKFSYDVLIAIFIIAIPTSLIRWRMVKKKSFPEKPKKLNFVITTILIAIVIYIILISLLFLAFKILYLT